MTKQRNCRYDNGLKAAKAFARRYEISCGGGWFELENCKVQGLWMLATELYRKGAIHGFGTPDKAWRPDQGAVTMVFELLDPIYGRSK